MKIKLIKLAAEVFAASLIFALGVNWCCPGEGLHFAANALGLNGSHNPYFFPLWSWLVRQTDGSLFFLRCISQGSAVVCVLLIGSIFANLVRVAVRQDADSMFRPVECAVVPLVILSFVLTPGFLYTATRVSPLMTVLAVPLSVVACLIRLLSTKPSSGRVADVDDQTRPSKGISWRVRLSVFLSLLVLLYSVFEVALTRRAVLHMAFVPFCVWLSVGVLPALVVMWCVRRRLLVRRSSQCYALGAWSVAVLVLGINTFASGVLERGRVANRIVGQILKNSAGRMAVVSEGGLDEMFLFMLPDYQRMITLSRDRDPAYGRDLAKWVRECLVSDAGVSTGQVEDLAFAAELGPRVLIDEWAKADAKKFESIVTTAPFYFPTREAWETSVEELEGMHPAEPLGEYLRWMLGWCGNALGCRLIEAGDKDGAWEVFWKISETVDPTNYAALINLFGMSERGQEGVKEKMVRVQTRMREMEGRLKTWEAIRWAAQAGGRLYVDPEERRRYENARREAAAKRDPTVEQRRFIETIASAARGPEQGRTARAAIRDAIGEGKVWADLIGDQLLGIDMALGDREGAERDAIDVLRVNRHHAMANATIGSLRTMSGDYEQSERYLRRAMASGNVSAGVKNDLAFTLMRLGRLAEAEPLAREAVKAAGDSWQFRETLAAILIRMDRTEEGERELDEAERLAEMQGVPKDRVTDFALDRALLRDRKDR